MPVLVSGDRAPVPPRAWGLLAPQPPSGGGPERNAPPLAPVSPYGKALVAERGDDTPVEWIGPERRYAEKLATPDITIADLLGEGDPIKVAEGRHLSDELATH